MHISHYVTVTIENTIENNLSLELNIWYLLQKFNVIIQIIVDNPAYGITGGKADGFWMGATDLDDEGQFIWQMSGSSVDPTQWFPGQPNNYYEQDCMMVTTDGFSDLDCGNPDKGVGICEMFIFGN